MSERRTRLLVGVLAALFIAPLMVLLVQAFADSWRAPGVLPDQLGWRGFEVAFGSARAGDALVNSLLVAFAATAISLVLGWPAARVLGMRRLPRNGFVFLLIGLPLLMPPYLAGFGLTEWFIRLGIDDSLAGIVLAHVTFALPYAILILLSGFNREVEALEEMAATTGAGPARRLAWVTLPALRPTLIAAALLSFLVSWSQYGTSLAVGAGRPTLPIVMLPFIQTDPEVAAALALVFLAPCIVALAFVARLQRTPL
jgi:putative spermidine/putrescine transport system permease protein